MGLQWDNSRYTDVACQWNCRRKRWYLSAGSWCWKKKLDLIKALMKNIFVIFIILTHTSLLLCLDSFAECRWTQILWDMITPSNDRIQNMENFSSTKSVLLYYCTQVRKREKIKSSRRTRNCRCCTVIFSVYNSWLS
jgi:hypothetical protein